MKIALHEKYWTIWPVKQAKQHSAEAFGESRELRERAHHGGGEDVAADGQSRPCGRRSRFEITASATVEENANATTALKGMRRVERSIPAPAVLGRRPLYLRGSVAPLITKAGPHPKRPEHRLR